MKTYRYSWVILFIIFSKSCQGMDKAIKNFAQLEKTTASEPIRAIAFLNKQEIVLGTKNGCCIINTQDTSRITQIHTNPVSWIAINRNRNKLLTWNGGAIHSYDTETKEFSELSNLPLIYSASFSPTDDTILVHKHRTSVSNCGKSYTLASHLESEFDIGYHPIQKQIIYPSNNSTLTTMDFEHGSYSPDCQLVIKNLYPGRQVQKIFYNNDASYLAVICNNNKYLHVNIYDPLTKSSHYLGICLAMKFHPNKIIAALVLKDGTIDFWNVKTCKHVMKQRLFTTRPPKSYSCHYDIDFSPNGLQFIILVNKQCFLGMVPPALYERETKDRCIFTWYMLKHFSHDNYTMFPQDIASLIMDNLIEISQF